MASAIAPLVVPENVSAASDCRQALLAGRAKLKAAFALKPDAAKALQAQCALVDEALKTIWTQTGQPEKLALVAVGGYGRGKLYPYSDVDVLVLLPEGAGDAARAGVEVLVGVLWDIGLEIGHSVRTVAECREEAKRDITVQTTLLETRMVCVPNATGTMKSATAAADPLDEPPGVCAGWCGFVVAPGWRKANSVVTVSRWHPAWPLTRRNSTPRNSPASGSPPCVRPASGPGGGSR